MFKAHGHAELWQRLGAILSFLAKGLGAGLSSIATLTFGGRAAPGGSANIAAVEGVSTVIDQHKLSLNLSLSLSGLTPSQGEQSALIRRRSRT